MNTRQITGYLHDLLEPRQHHAPSFRVSGPTIAGRAFRGRHPRELTVVAHLSPSSREAERLRLSLIDGAGRLQDGAWSLVSPVIAVEVPPHLINHPATMLGWTTKSHVRVDHWTAAWVRRGRVTWEVLAMDDDPNLEGVVGQIATSLMMREWQFTGQSLWDLMPLASDLPVPMHLDASLGEDPLTTLAEAA